MNYIKHLNQWFDILAVNHEVKPTHITLYFVLFQLWNTNRFPDQFLINRHLMINLSKLGSTATYSKCMADLHRWGWIDYQPSTSKLGVSKVSLFSWANSTVSESELMGKIKEEKPPAKEVSSASTESSNEPSSDTSSESSTKPSSVLSSKQEVGHLSKEINNKPSLKNNNINSNFKSKFHEPL